MKGQRSPTEDEHWLTFGLAPKPGGNPPGIPADYLYDPDGDVYWNPRHPGRFMRPRTTPAVIDRRVLPNGEVEEWERPGTIPDDFIYDPETHSYYPPGERTKFDVEAWMREFKEEMSNESEEERRKGLISVDVLRAAGALDVPPSWRKSLGGGRNLRRNDLEQRDLFSALLDNDDLDPPEQGQVEDDAADEATEDEGS